jgi:hypothetical protein
MTLTLTNSILLMLMATIISREQILEEVPIGMPEQQMVAYFLAITDAERIRYFTRENSPDGNTVSHSLQNGEAGYYIVGLPDVKRHWWWPSFGRHLSVIVVISEDRTVSEIKFFGARSGWP